MTTPNTAWALTYLHKTYAYLPSSHTFLSISRIYTEYTKKQNTQNTHYPQLPHTEGGKP